MSESLDSADAVFVVSSAMGVLQVFADESDAQHYAVQLAGARVSRHLLRASLAEAVVILDRRVVVRNGQKRVDESTKLRQFIDDPLYLPETADVEWFQGEDGENWHIAGFGTDEEQLEAMMDAALAEVRELSMAAAKTDRLDQSDRLDPDRLDQSDRLDPTG